MPIFIVDETERFPDYSLRPATGKTGKRRERAGQGWMERARIEMTDEEYDAWLFASKLYADWLTLIEKRLAVLPPTSEEVVEQ